MADIYTENARHYHEQYQSLDFEGVHADWLHLLPEQPGFALDVGAGSGRDAAALARRGWDVLAIEPSEGLRRLGEQATRRLSVQWQDDRLPELARARALSYRFNLILVSAVWMHLPPAQRERAFRILTELLAPGGLLVITLRHGPSPDARVFHDIDLGELEALARKRALVTLHARRNADKLDRPDVWWETFAVRLPDDGTGALPLLRHVIVNDDKSSTYKLGLLRAVTRIADGVPGMVLERTDDWVEIPLGLVGLYWIKLYQPLILQYGLRQLPRPSGYGFACEDFNALADLSPLDLRVGQALAGDWAVTVQRAIRDACHTIARMPARYITHPGTRQPVFETDVRRTRLAPGAVRLNRELLARFGRFRVPAALWDCCSRYACWLEPAIVNEWADLMRGYQVSYGDTDPAAALRWEDGRRDTTLIRRLVDEKVSAGRHVHCVWTNSDLRWRAYDIDHCFPWSRWSNNDLWNLLPAAVAANSSKREKLPAASLLEASRPQILEWWDGAYLGTAREEQFFTEAQAALPMLAESPDLQTVFEGVARQRMRLKINQQLAEWYGLGNAGA